MIQSVWQRGVTFSLVTALTGCVSLPIPSNRRAVKPLPPELAQHYQYAPTTFETRIEFIETKEDFILHKIKLISPNGEIKLEWYKPKEIKEPLPLILMSPILAGDDLYISEFADFFASRKLHAVLVYRPEIVFSTDKELIEVENHFRESIVGLRQVLDWLEKQPNIDQEKIGTFAISMGAILTAILAAVDPRIKASVLGLPAGEIPEIIMTSKDKSIRKRRDAFLEARGWSKAEGLAQLQKIFVSDPLKFAPSLDPNQTMLIGGLFDRVLGFHRTLKLWKALGRPKLTVLPTGHYSAVLATPGLKASAYSFLVRKLGASKRFRKERL